MAGVNLSEESARILATNSELVGTLTRSCSDVPVLNTAALQRRMSEIGEITSVLYIHPGQHTMSFSSHDFQL